MKDWKVRNNFYLHEVALLMLNLNPDNYNNFDELLNSPPKGFKSLYGRILDSACSDAGVEVSQDAPGEYYQSYELMTNKSPSIKELSFHEGEKILVSTGAMVDWIKNNKNRDNPLPDAFFTVASDKLTEDKPVRNAEIVTEKERDSMLKIILALAHNGYKYPSHGAVKEMLRDFQIHENGVSENTLNKYLKEADKL